MRTSSRHVAFALLALALTSSGCSGGAARGHVDTPARPIDDDTAASLKEYHRYHHHGGLALFVALGLDTLGVAPDQRDAVEKIRLDLQRSLEPARLADQRLLVGLADGLDAGSLDPTTVDAAMVQVRGVNAAAREASAMALNELHGVLTTAERTALVDKVEAHWSVWQNANGQTEDGHLAVLTGELDLTEEQVDKIRAGLGGGAKMPEGSGVQELAAEVHAFAATFRTDAFDPKRLTSGGVPGASLAGWGAARLTNFVETGLLVLTPDQRARFALQLREHGGHPSLAQGNP